MSYSPSSKEPSGCLTTPERISLSPGGAALFLLCAALLVPSLTEAQTKVDRQWITSGLTVAPTVVTDSEVDGVTMGGGLRLRLGLQHVVARQFLMAAEAELGENYFNASRLAPDGSAESTHHFAWQVGLVGRWVPGDEVAGPAVGFGLHTFRASLPEAPLQTLSGDLRLGWYLWRDEHFVLAEIGYAVPFLEGIDTPSTFGEEAPDVVEQTWMLHRFMFGFSYGF